MNARAQLDAALKASKKSKQQPRAKWTLDARGRNHPSEEEAEWFNGLYREESAGLIQILEIEPQWTIRIPDRVGKLTELCVVKADAKVRVPDSGAIRYLDYKGRMGDTPVSRLKRLAVRIQYGIEIELVGKYIERKARASAKKKADRDLLKRQKRSNLKR